MDIDYILALNTTCLCFFNYLISVYFALNINLTFKKNVHMVMGTIHRYRHTYWTVIDSLCGVLLAWLHC